MKENKAAETIKIGDVIMPPERELRLWMRRHVAQKGLTESALHLRVKEVMEGKPDKNGRWLFIKTEHTDTLAFNLFPFSFKARPKTPWQIVEKSEARQ